MKFDDTDSDDLGIFSFCGEFKSSQDAKVYKDGIQDHVSALLGKEETAKQNLKKENLVDLSGQYRETFAIPNADAANDQEIIQYADKYWRGRKVPKFKDEFVREIWSRFFLEDNFSVRKLFCLDLYGYLNEYLWPNYSWEETPEQCRSSIEHMLSIVMMINEKFRLVNRDHWTILTKDQRKFAGFVTKVLGMAISPYSPEGPEVHLGLFYRRAILTFLTNLFHCLENPIVKSESLRVVRIGIWTHITPEYRESILNQYEDLKKNWKMFLIRSGNDGITCASAPSSSLSKNKSGRGKSNAVTRRSKKDSTFSRVPDMDDVVLLRGFLERSFFFKYASVFIQILNSTPVLKEVHQRVLYCEKFLEFITDILSQLSVRRYLNTLLKHLHFYSRIKLSSMYTMRCSSADAENTQVNTIFPELFENLVDCAYSYVNDFTGEPLYGLLMEKDFYSRILQLQRIAFKKLPEEEFSDLVTSNTHTLSSSEVLRKHISNLTNNGTSIICSSIGLLTNDDPTYASFADVDKKSFDVTIDIMVESIVLYHQLRTPGKKFTENMTILPDEKSLYEENSTSHMKRVNYMHNILVPKINLHFLSMEDYLLRNLKLYIVESNFTIAQDINSVIYHINPKSSMNAKFGKEVTFFSGSSPSALPIDPPKIVRINPEKLWEKPPSAVYMDICLNLDRTPLQFREQWKTFRENEVMFLLTVDSSSNDSSLKSGFATNGEVKKRKNANTWRHPSLSCVRGCRFVSYAGDPLTGTSDYEDKKYAFSPSKRNWRDDGCNANLRWIRVALEPSKYQEDVFNKCAPTENDRLNFTNIAENNLYTRMNILVKRRPQESNFESTLPLLFEKLKTPKYTGPEWLYNIFLGHGNPLTLSQKNVDNSIFILDCNDIFQSIDHIKEYFSGYPLSLGYSYLNSSGSDSQPDKKDLKKRGKRTSKARVATKEKTQKKVSLEAPTAQNYFQYVPPYVLFFPKSYFMNAEEIATEDMEKYITPGAKAALSKLHWHHMSDESKIDYFAESGFTPYQLDYKSLNVEDNAVFVNSISKKGLTPLHSLLISSTPASVENIRYTNTQIDGIISGLSKTLTLIVGPPGSGKTDVAVRIVASLHKNFPNERILLVTHSNQALNQAFEKVFNIGIDPRYILRLGHGEEELQIEYNYRNAELETTQNKPISARYGRVNAFLEARINFLDKVSSLAGSLDMPESHGDTCRTAEYFKTYRITPIWYNFIEKVKMLISEAPNKQNLSARAIQDLFPFYKYFLSVAAKQLPNASDEDLKQALFPDTLSFVETLEAAKVYYEHIEYIFDHLKQISAFEILTSHHERSNYLLTEHARIIAMTCTMGALKYNSFSNLNLKYDSIIMEEASQVLEAETFAPIFMQHIDNDAEDKRLKRIIMIGDHNQLPPVVKNRALQRYSNMEQSLFLRFLRLGVPVVQLDAQGRCRPSICDLFRWSYSNLKDLQCITDNPLMKKANPGFAFEFQVIDVPLNNNMGEFQPRLHFVQNYQEAEYIVHVYTYMILLGYPSRKIAILTVYNGQQELISHTLDVYREKYRRYNFQLPMPYQVTTVDKFQGQQADYVLLSLTRTRIIGLLRDVRRLIVAVSRARLGLYIFGFTPLLSKCLDISELWSRLCARPTDGLWVFSGEKYSDILDNLDKFRDADSKVVDKSKKSDSQYEVKPKFKNNVFKISNFSHMSAYVDQMFKERSEYIATQDPTSSSVS